MFTRRKCCRCGYTHMLIDTATHATLWTRDYMTGAPPAPGATPQVMCVEPGPSGTVGLLAAHQVSAGWGAFSLYNTDGERIWSALEGTNFTASIPVEYKLAYDSFNDEWAVLTAGNLVRKFDSAGTQLWASPSPPSGYGWTHPVVDSNGNVWVLEVDLFADPFTGVFASSRLVQFDSDDGTVAARYTSGMLTHHCMVLADDEFICFSDSQGCRVYDTSGAIVTSRVLPKPAGTNTLHESFGAVDSSGNLYLLYSQFSLTSGTIAKIDTSGSIVWATAMTGPSGSMDMLGRIVLDEANGIVYVHHFYTTARIMRFDMSTGSQSTSILNYTGGASVCGHDFALLPEGIVWGGVRTR